MFLKVFCSFAPSDRDEDLRDELKKHLRSLLSPGSIVSWRDRSIPPDADAWIQIDAELRAADIILFLVTPEFLASDYIDGAEMRLALERHARREAVVIPIVLRPCDWTGTPFSHLQPLPCDGRPIVRWPNPGEAFADIARGLEELAAGLASSIPRLVPEPRVLDAAIPSRIVKERSTELLVLIRRPGSPGLAGALQTDDEAEAKPEDVRSKDFEMRFPLGPDRRPAALPVTIQISSPEFDPPTQRKTILAPPDGDSAVCHFLLTPLRTGQLRVLIELHWEDALRGARRLRTECQAEAEDRVSAFNLVHLPLGGSFQSVGAMVGGNLMMGGSTWTPTVPAPPAPPATSPAAGELARRFSSASEPKPLSAQFPRPATSPPPAAGSPATAQKENSARGGSWSGGQMGYSGGRQLSDFERAQKDYSSGRPGGSADRYAFRRGYTSYGSAPAPSAPPRSSRRFGILPVLAGALILVAGLAFMGIATRGKPPVSAPVPMESAAPPRPSIAGQLIDASTGQAIAGASVRVIGGTAAHPSDAGGRFSLQIPPGASSLRLEITKPGCRPLIETIDAREVHAYNLTLKMTCAAAPPPASR